MTMLQRREQRLEDDAPHELDGWDRVESPEPREPRSQAVGGVADLVRVRVRVRVGVGVRVRVGVSLTCSADSIALESFCSISEKRCSFERLGDISSWLG